MNLQPLVNRRFVVGTPQAIVAFDYEVCPQSELVYLACAAEGGATPHPAGLDGQARISIDASTRNAYATAMQMVERALQWLASQSIQNQSQIWGYDAGYFARCMDAEARGFSVDRVVKFCVGNNKKLLPEKAVMETMEAETDDLEAESPPQVAAPSSGITLQFSEAAQACFDFA